MKRHRRSIESALAKQHFGRVTLVLAMGVLAVYTGTPRGQSLISVGKNVLVSAAARNAVHYEVLLAAHPTDGRQLIACTQRYDPASNRNSTAVYVSTDAGHAWTETLKTDHLDESGDPSCTYGIDDSAYHVMLGQSFSSRQWGGVEPTTRLTIPVYRSTDGGRTWRESAVLNTSSTANDREWIVVDQTNGPYRGHIYLESTLWTLGTGTSRERAIALYRSRDGGTTFEGPVTRTTERPGFTHVPSNAVVAADGTVIFAFTELNDALGDQGDVKPRESGVTNATLKAVASRDGGESLDAPVKIDDLTLVTGVINVSIPSLAVDPGSASFKDRLYITWSDARSGRSEVLLAYSDDQARSWSKPVIVNDDEPHAAGAGEHYLPTVAVNRDGVVGVLWYDRREHPNTLGYCPQFSASLDGGVTFLPSARVAEVCATVGGDEGWPVWAQGTARPPTGGPLRINVWVFPRFYTGADTAGLVANTTGGFHALWVDNRTGLPQVWTAPITVTGSARRSGSQTLENLDDVTAKVALEVTATHYDRATRHARIDLRLRNVSTAILSAPLRVRLVTLASRLGAVRITNQDSGPDRAGAELDFTPMLERGVLKPQARTKSRPLIFELSNVKPFYAGGRSFTPGLILSDFRVYASRAGEPTAAPPR